MNPLTKSFFFLILLLSGPISSAQTTEKLWNELKETFGERNKAISEILSSSSDFREVSDELRGSIKSSMDSIARELTIHQRAEKLGIRRLERVNRFLTRQLQSLTNMIEEKSNNSNYGNAIRLISIYKKEEEKFEKAVKVFNLKCKQSKREDLIFNLL
jgi:hypothetical protein